MITITLTKAEAAALLFLLAREEMRSGDSSGRSQCYGIPLRVAAESDVSDEGLEALRNKIAEAAGIDAGGWLP